MLGVIGRGWSELSNHLHVLHRTAADPSAQAAAFDAVLLANELRARHLELEVQNRKLRAAHDSLQASRERLALLYDFAPVGYVTIDSSGSVEEMNLTAAAMLRADRHATIGADFATAAGIEDADAIRRHLEACLRDGQRRTAELTARPGGGPTIVLQLTSTPVSPAGGRGFSLTVLADVTDSRRMERERQALVEHAREVAEAANRMKDDFLGVVSHELRTPLTAVLGWAHVLTEHPSPAPALVERGLRVMRRNAQALAHIVDDILDVSRIVTGKLRVELRPVDVEPLVQAVVDGLRPTAEGKGLAVSVMAQPGCRVLGDPERLQQVVWNLVSNAVKFTPAGGSVKVTAGQVSGSVRIAVRDTGRGIDARDLPHVFERFRQVDSSTTRAHAGLGLGLAIVKHIVEAHGGLVVAESAGLHRGALFSVHIPRDPGQPETVAPSDQSDLPAWDRESDVPESTPVPVTTAMRSAAALSGLRVLVVDDEADTLDLTALALAQRGAEVKTARSAREALAVLVAFAPDALVCDIAMPGIDGYDLVSRLRATCAPCSAVPAVALSGHARPEDADRALRAGFQRHVAKPVSADALAGILHDLTRGVEEKAFLR